jgi:hypothetical protein
MNWKQKVKVNEVPIPVFKEPSPTPTELREAAQRWDARSDSFAEGKAETCRSMADNLERFGSYASDKQQGYAAKLITWSLPRERVWVDPVPVPALASGGGGLTIGSDPSYSPPPSLPVSSLFAVMQKHSTFYVDPLRIHRKNQDSLCWVLWDEKIVGKIENGTAHLWSARCNQAGIGVESIISRLKEFEADPLGAAMKYGKLAGRCCSCGRDLTDPESIERGIGPVCATKFGGF